MLTLRDRVAGEEVTIHIVSSLEELVQSGFREFISRNTRIALDTETNAHGVYQQSFRTRTVQISNATESFVFQVEKDARIRYELAGLLEQTRYIYIHNAMFDIPVMRRLGIHSDLFWDRWCDTQVLAHLVDSRETKEGGPGLSLENLTRHYIDPEIADRVKHSMTLLARELKLKKTEVFEHIDIDNQDYLRYAGIDPILTFRLAEKLLPLVPNRSHGLIEFEKDVQRICEGMQKRGMKLDVPYTENLRDEMTRREEEAVLQLNGVFLVDSPNSADEIEFGFERLGVQLTQRTANGKAAVSSEVLDSFISLTENGDPVTPEWGSPGHLALAISEAKKWRKWRTTWLESFLENRDADDRCHPNIHTLRARTARMSITGIPAQTLPSGDSLIRNCFIANDDQQIVSVDFANQELRVLAALSQDEIMLQAFRDGLDLHQITADAAGVSRKIGKMTNFQTAYGGGANALASAAGIPFLTAKKVHEAFAARYTGFTRWKDKIVEEARRNGCVWTPTGRRIIVDSDRAYSATNYEIQSTSRDVTCHGLIELDRQGLAEYLLLPIHDEVLASVPENEAEELARLIAKTMEMRFRGLDITTDWEIAGRSWGGKYE